MIFTADGIIFNDRSVMNRREQITVNAHYKFDSSLFTGEVQSTMSMLKGDWVHLVNEPAMIDVNILSADRRQSNRWT